jgi:lipid kinase YegS
VARSRHWRLIVNGKSADAPGLREAVLARRGAGRRFDVRVTWERGDAARYVDEAIADHVDVLIAGGGDGTLGEVAGALAARRDDASPRPLLASLPLGTANDFASAAGIPPELDDALALLVHGRAHEVDILRARIGGRSHWCMNLASGGFGTDATVEAHEFLKRVLGGFSYVVRGLARLHAIESQPIELQGPGFRWAGPMIVLGIGNARQAGGGQALCPAALIDDGLLDVTIIPELDEGMGRTVATVIREGKRATLERVAEQARVPWVEVRSPAPIRLNLDGEPVAAARLRIECVPRALRMLLPRDCPLLSPRSSPPRGMHMPDPHRMAGTEPL